MICACWLRKRSQCQHVSEQAPDCRPRRRSAWRRWRRRTRRASGRRCCRPASTRCGACPRTPRSSRSASSAAWTCTCARARRRSAPSWPRRRACCRGCPSRATCSPSPAPWRCASWATPRRCAWLTGRRFRALIQCEVLWTTASALALQDSGSSIAPLHRLQQLAMPRALALPCRLALSVHADILLH